MSVDPASVWYIARDGEIVWQGTANQLLNWIETGGIQGNEAAWSEGFTAWVSVHLDPTTQWIRQAVAHHDERTGEPTEFSHPEGTASLNLPNVAEDGESPFAGPRPERNRAQAKAKVGGGLSLGLSAGVVIGLAVAYVLFATNQSSEPPTPETSAKTLAPTQTTSDDAPGATNPHDAKNQVTPKQDPSSVPAKRPASPNKSAIQAPPKSPDTKTSIAKKTQKMPEAPAVLQPDKTSAESSSAKPSKSSIRIVRKKKLGVALPQGSANRDEEIKRSMNVRKAIWDACVQRAQKDYPALVGRLMFTISVTKEGAINGVAGPPGNQGAQYAAACLLGEFDNLTFPPGRAAQIQFPYTTP